MAAKPSGGVGAVMKNILSNSLARAVARPVLDAVVPTLRQKIGRRPLAAIGAGSAGAAATLQYLRRNGAINIPDNVAGPVTIGIMLAGMLAGQAAVTPVADPRLTPEQIAKAKALAAVKKIAGK